MARAHSDEYALLGMTPGNRAYVREVMLLCNGVPVVFAHSVLPPAGLRGGWSGITRLGSRSLGEALFSDHASSASPWLTAACGAIIRCIAPRQGSRR